MSLGPYNASALHMLQRFLGGQFALIVFDPGVTWWTRGHVLIRGRHFFIPADAQSRPLCDDGLELHPQHPRGAGRHSTPGTLARRLLFRHDDLEDNVVVHGETGRRLDVAHGVTIGFDSGHELQGDLAALGIIIRFPSILDFVASN